MKVVINGCYGGFGISLAGAKRMAELGHEGARKEVAEYEAKASGETALSGLEKKLGHQWYGSFCDTERHDPALVQMVEEMGAVGGGDFSDLRIAEIPDGVSYIIEEYDGIEHVAESHRTWR